MTSPCIIYAWGPVCDLVPHFMKMTGRAFQPDRLPWKLSMKWSLRYNFPFMISSDLCLRCPSLKPMGHFPGVKSFGLSTPIWKEETQGHLSWPACSYFFPTWRPEGPHLWGHFFAKCVFHLLWQGFLGVRGPENCGTIFVG